MADGRKKTVLIMEDEMQMRFYLMTMVRSLGFEPLVTRDGAQGLDALGKGLVDMIILDIMMPEKGGALVYQALKGHKAWQDIPLLIFSGVDQSAFAHYIRMLGAGSGKTVPFPQFYVEKSADPDYLKAMILKCMEGGRL